MKKQRIFRAGIVLCAMLVLFVAAREHKETARTAFVETTQNIVKTELYAGVAAEFHKIQSAYVQENKELLVAAAEEEKLSEEGVYSFLQGPRSWGEQIAWSGEWCMKYAKGHYFGGFGCGLCCMANIYSTLTDYTCSPLDMYEYATTVSHYYPSKESGAIGWEDMRTTLQMSGFECELYRKPESYEEFQQQIAASQSAIVLVSSYNDDTFWEDTPGHYVNIWLYNEESDEVFLAEPGSPTNNRSWIPLRYVYDALKTVSQYQFLTVGAYNEEDNLWRHDGIEEQWVAP